MINISNFDVFKSSNRLKIKQWKFYKINRNFIKYFRVMHINAIYRKYIKSRCNDEKWPIFYAGPFRRNTGNTDLQFYMGICRCDLHPNKIRRVSPCSLIIFMFHGQVIDFIILFKFFAYQKTFLFWSCILLINDK